MARVEGRSQCRVDLWKTFFSFEGDLFFFEGPWDNSFLAFVTARSGRLGPGRPEQ